MQKQKMNLKMLRIYKKELTQNDITTNLNGGIVEQDNLLVHCDFK